MIIHPPFAPAPVTEQKLMSLMQTLVPQSGYDSPDMSAPRAALLERLEEVATREWLAVLRESAGK